MVNPVLCLQVNLLLVTALLASVCSAEDYWPSLFVLSLVTPVNKRQVIKDVMFQRRYRGGGGTPGSITGIRGGATLTKYKGDGSLEIQVSPIPVYSGELTWGTFKRVLPGLDDAVPGLRKDFNGNTASVTLFAYDNNEDWLTLGENLDKDPSAQVTIKNYPQQAPDVCDQGFMARCRIALLGTFSFALPNRRDVILDAYSKYENAFEWDLYVAGGDGSVVGDCYLKEGETVKKVGKSAARVLQCHVWGIN